MRAPVADSVSRPNHIEFAIIGCNPGAELCPLMTEGFSQSPASMSLAVQGRKATLAAALNDLATASGTAFKDGKAIEAMRARIEAELKAADAQAHALTAQSQVI